MDPRDVRPDGGNTRTRRRRRLVAVALVLVAAFVAFRVLANRLEEGIAATIEREAAGLGARARVERVRVSLLPPLHLSGVVIEKPGQWEARCESVSMSLRPWGRTGWGVYGRLSLGPATLTLPADLELQMNPSEWEVSPQGSAELRAPAEGLTLTAVTGAGGRGLEAKASGLETGLLGQLLLEGAKAPGLGVVDGEARGESRAGQGFEAHWRLEALEAESTGEITIAASPGGPRLELALEIERLDFARLLAALAVEPPAGAEALGSLRAGFSASGPLADPASLAVTQRLEYTPPPGLPPALARLRGDFVHEVVTSDGTRQTIEVAATSPGFIARADVPSLFIQTLLLGEDAAFFSHRGLDLTELPKAIAANWARGTTVRGASTITQQLAKNLFLTREKSLRRKLQELALAFLLESTLGKDRILEIYLNVIEWGPGLYGLRPAARHYFGKEPVALTPKETAFLVTLIPGPVKYRRSFEEGALSPGLEPLVANLLAKLRSVNALSEAEYEAALAETLAFRRPEPTQSLGGAGGTGAARSAGRDTAVSAESPARAR